MGGSPLRVRRCLLSIRSTGLVAAPRPRVTAPPPEAERPARDGAAKARKAPAAQRPARTGATARRKNRSGDKHAATG